MSASRITRAWISEICLLLRRQMSLLKRNPCSDIDNLFCLHPQLRVNLQQSPAFCIPVVHDLFSDRFQHIKLVQPDSLTEKATSDHLANLCPVDIRC
jgi:hypothetical protein